MSDKIDSAALVENMETENASPEKKSQKSTGKSNKDGPLSGAGDEMENHYALPAELRRRVNALRKLQLEAVTIETEFYRRVHELEYEYAERMAPLNDKRRQIVNGLHEPNDEECNITVPFEEVFLADELQKQEAINKDLPESERPDGKGISEFWLTVFRNDPALAGTVQSWDEPILKHLTDIQVEITKDPMNFTLRFHFSPNDYFTNTVLTKEYMMQCKVDPDTPFEFDGPEIVGCKGCNIDWKAGKNVTVKVVKKKQKHKQKGATRIVSKEVKADSFFNFFEPPVIPEGQDEEDMGEEIRQTLQDDYEIGQLLRDRVIPRAVLYYTGEILEEDDDYEDEDDDEDEDEELEDSEDEDEEPEDNRPKKRNHK